MTTVTDFATFFFNLFSGNLNPELKKGALAVDGKNDALFLKRINDEFYKKSTSLKDFTDKFEPVLADANSPITKWVNERFTILGKNFSVVLWSAWKTITTPK